MCFHKHKWALANVSVREQCLAFKPITKLICFFKCFDLQDSEVQQAEMKPVISKPLCHNSSKSILWQWWDSVTAEKQEKTGSQHWDAAECISDNCCFLLSAEVVVVAWCLSSCSGLCDSDSIRVAEIIFAFSFCYISSPQLGIHTNFCDILLLSFYWHFPHVSF